MTHALFELAFQFELYWNWFYMISSYAVQNTTRNPQIDSLGTKNAAL